MYVVKRQELYDSEDDLNNIKSISYLFDGLFSFDYSFYTYESESKKFKAKQSYTGRQLIINFPSVNNVNNNVQNELEYDDDEEDEENEKPEERRNRKTEHKILSELICGYFNEPKEAKGFKDENGNELKCEEILLLNSYPSILMINLKRFKFDGSNEKWKYEIEFEESFDLKEIINNIKDNNKDNTSYELYSFIIYAEDQTKNFQYETISKNFKDNSYYLFNGDKCIKLEHFNCNDYSNSVYILYYKRKDINFDNLDIDKIESEYREKDIENMEDEIENEDGGGGEGGNGNTEFKRSSFPNPGDSFKRS